MRIQNKLILAFLVTVLLPLIGTGLYGNWTTSRALQSQAVENAQADLRLRAAQMEEYLDNVREDILFLSRLDSLQTFVNASQPTSQMRTDLEIDFASFAMTHPGVFQMRYISESGMEVVRIDSSEEDVEIVPEALLQDKSDRYYFQAALALSPGEVFISPIDLNRERGILQIPHTPTIRYAARVFHEDGATAGIVILNLYANQLLRFAESDPNDPVVLGLADMDGYYLAHPQQEKRWGSSRDLDSGAQASADYPGVWDLIRQSPAGMYADPPENLLAGLWDELLPVGLLPGYQGRLDERRVIVYQIVYADGDDDPRWILFQDSPHSHLFASIWTFRLTAILILFFASAAAMGIAFVLARSLTSPITVLTKNVQRFTQTRLGATLQEKRSRRMSWLGQDETQKLMEAFQSMSAQIDRHIEQLGMLNRAGHHIAARLERPAVLEAACLAIERLLPVEYISISLEKNVIHERGNNAWAKHRQSETVEAVLDAALAEADWHTMGLSSEEEPAGFLCCAPLCVGSRLGLIEVYGSDPALGMSASGELLATLCAQISISLDNADLYERLAEHRVELQALVERLINAQEEERRLVAYDIHDGLIQMLVGARLQLNNAFVEHDPARAESAQRKGLGELASAIAEARRVIEGLRPASLDDLGLGTALRQFAEDSLVESNCELEFIAIPKELRLPPMIAITAFRIAQESITNARKYSNTTRLRVTLNLSDGALDIEIRDWGNGFDPQAVREGRGVGLMGMRERARLLDGECVVESAPGAGTIVRATLPVNAPTTDNCSLITDGYQP